MLISIKKCTIIIICQHKSLLKPRGKTVNILPDQSRRRCIYYSIVYMLIEASFPFVLNDLSQRRLNLIGDRVSPHRAVVCYVTKQIALETFDMV
jgi:hypothetical protein